MSAATILMMADGHGIDLLDIKAENICFVTLAEHLGKEKRYNGATPRTEYSVAQHCVLGADAILADGGTETESAYFLLHDAQEAVWKDDPTPKKRAIAERIQDRCGVTADRILDVLNGIVAEHDAAIHQAAGLPYPIPPEIEQIIHLYDKKMFVTEWQQLMHDWPHPNWSDYAGLDPINTKIKPWRWDYACNQWMSRAKKLLPLFRLGGTPNIIEPVHEFSEASV